MDTFTGNYIKNWVVKPTVGSGTYGQFFDLRYSIGATADRRLLIADTKGHHNTDQRYGD